MNDCHSHISSTLLKGILTIYLDREEYLNAFTPQMADELVDAFDRASQDNEVRAIVVTGRGRAFCAGMDLDAEGNVFGLDESQTPTIEDLREQIGASENEHSVRDTGGRVSLSIIRCTKPVIAAINGPAIGVGATITLPMDFRIASETSRIGFVFSKLGIVPEACSSWYLPKLVGLTAALELTYSGRIMTAQESLDIGLVQQIHPEGDLVDRACAFARELVRNKSTLAMALTRRMMHSHSNLPTPTDAHLVESVAMFYCSVGDGKEGVSAFLEKRVPDFALDSLTTAPEALRSAFGWERSRA